MGVDMLKLMRNERSQTDNDIHVIRGALPLPDEGSEKIHLRLYDLRRWRSCAKRSHERQKRDESPAPARLSLPGALGSDRNDGVSARRLLKTSDQIYRLKYPRVLAGLVAFRTWFGARRRGSGEGRVQKRAMSWIRRAMRSWQATCDKWRLLEVELLGNALRNEERRNRKVESNEIVVMGNVACIEEVWRRKVEKGKRKR